MKEEIITNEEKIKQLEEERKWLIEFIEQKCIYDDHLQGYCFDLKKSDVRTLMYKLKNKQ